MSYDFKGEGNPRVPQSGTGVDLFDEFERDNVEYNPEDAVRVTPFIVPGTSEPFSMLATMRDENGRIAGRLVAFDNFTQRLRYEYDAGGRLHKVWSNEDLIEEYLYGKSGERYFGVTSRIPQRSFRYGPGLRLEKAGNVKYSYDGQGRLILKQHGPETTRYSYDDSGQLQLVKLSDGTRISYEIDSEGKRISKSINSHKVETYHWHDFTTLSAVVDRFGNSREFAYDEDGDPIAMRFKENVYYFAADQVGTIYMVANGEGNEVKRIIRDSFGNVIVDTNKQMEIPLGFAAGLYDKDTRLVHFGYREYNPTIGRFIQPDPLGLAGGDVDVYGYCADDPVNFIDRVGLFDVSGSGHAGAHGSASFGGSLGGDSLGLGVSGSAHAGARGSASFGSGGFGGEGQNRNITNGGQNAANNTNYTQGNATALTALNQSGAQKGKAVAQSAAELADKQAKFDAQQLAKDNKALAAAAKRDNQRRAGMEKANALSSPLTNTVDPNGQAKPNTTQNDPAKTSAQHAREMEKTYKEVAKKQRADEKARKDNIARAGSELREARLRGDARANKGKKDKDDFGLTDLGEGALIGGVGGAIGLGAYAGSVFGPPGVLAGAIAGGFYGSAWGGLKKVGFKALSDKFGVDRKEMEDAFGILGTAKPNTHKRDFT
ncbi:RHS repeat domain-containing protein [Desulfovibrio sp. JC010]|uniref:RHS repeat domain-containing protein n=1 Tax=Desulfovibrio sp. JC010 TaxID=2593641 RepID=UPI0013D484CA|nr:RHS repeat-associated core domain-containing protein [Desulfovibrio sp. JC010]NDV28468.1 hypothetical protein [Desulfovibrio sp. JC010]